MRVITLRPANSSAIGIGSLPGWFFYNFMDNKNKKFDFNESQTSTNSHECDGDPTAFCYMCGDFKNKKNLRTFSEDLKNVFEQCFNSEVNRRNVHWLSQKICSGCKMMLNRWQLSKTKVKFVKPIVWRELNSKEDCYFCMTNTKGFNSSNSHKIQCTHVSSIIKASTVSENSDEKIMKISIHQSQIWK